MMRRAIRRGVYSDSLQPGGQRMIRTYSNGRKVYYRWSETDPATGAGVWLLDPEGSSVRDVYDCDGTNASASLLLNDHHEVVGAEDKEGYIDHCERCGFAAGWVQPTILGPDEKGHATTASTADVQAWIEGDAK